MTTSFSLNKLSHNAYCLVGDQSTGDKLISILNKDFSIPIQGNSDFFQKKYGNFTIDDARELKLAHEMRPITINGKKIFIIIADNINIEAQNALLKLLEEPAEYAHFFIIIPGTHLLLPTVRSRLSFIEVLDNHDNKNDKDDLGLEAKKFIDLNKARRLDMIKKLLDDITKEKKTKQDAINFLNSIQENIYREKGLKGNTDALVSIEAVRQYMNDRSPSLKMLLEYVALSI